MYQNYSLLLQQSGSGAQAVKTIKKVQQHMQFVVRGCMHTKWMDMGDFTFVGESTQCEEFFNYKALRAMEEQLQATILEQNPDLAKQSPVTWKETLFQRFIGDTWRATMHIMGTIIQEGCHAASCLVGRHKVALVGTPSLGNCIRCVARTGASNMCDRLVPIPRCQQGS